MAPETSRCQRWLRVGVLLGLWLLGGTALAAPDGLLTGDLGRWIDDEAAPQLAETLSRHPRFAGETVRLVTLTPGDPGAGNALGRAVERRLRQRLLAVDGIRLAADAPRRGCEAPRTVDYLLRIELSATGGRGARVQIAVVDVAESVWVSGVSHQWQGRLSSAEVRAMSQAVSQSSPGSAGNPLAVGDAAGVAAAMQADLACLLPRDLGGAVFVVMPADEALARVSLALQRNLMLEPLAPVTADRAAAQWLLSLEQDAGSTDPREIHLVLRRADGDRPQRVASAFVTGLASVGQSLATADPAPPRASPAPSPSVAALPRSSPPSSVAAPPAPPPAMQRLISPLRVTPARREGVCDSRQARVNSCVEIDFDLHSAAYLFVLSTQNHRVVDVPCHAPERSAAGPRRFRVRLPPGGYAVDAADTGPDGGFYVLATRDADVAAALQRVMAGVPGQCGSPGGSAGGWLSGLAALLDRHAQAVDWQAVHLVHDHAGIAAL